MTDWSDLEAEARRRTREAGPRCQVEVFLSHLEPEDAKAIKNVLELPGLTTAGIQRAIAVRIGLIAPSAWSIGNHRRGKCRCSR